MSYTKKRYTKKHSLGALISREGRTTESVQVEYQKATDPERTEAIRRFEEMKANWPRCKDSRTGQIIPDLYLYKFVDGKTLCHKGWSDKYYGMMVRGEPLETAPPYPGKPGTDQYFRSLCKAQGDGALHPEVQKIRVGFDEAGIAWKPSGDHRMRTLTPPYDDPSRLKPKIGEEYIQDCSRFVNEKGGNEPSWRNQAYYYSVNPEIREKRAEEAGKRTAERRFTQEKAALCLSVGVPEEALDCCIPILAERGMTPEKFLELAAKQDPKIYNCIAQGMQARADKKNRTMLYVAGGVAALAVGISLLKKGKKR
jgi:hypothetical protein